MDDRLLGLLAAPAPGREALRFPGATLTQEQLRDAALALTPALIGAGRVAVWAQPRAETAVAVVAALAAGVPAVPLNPRSGERELAHVLGDSMPELLLCAPDAQLPSGAGGVTRLDVSPAGAGGPLPAEPDPEAPALVVYTSGTTGPPKGAVLSRRALAFDLDALAAAWAWTDEDVVACGLPLFHVHGLVLGLLGPLRRGGTAVHLGRFSPEAAAAALADGATMLFGVPTMYRRLADAAQDDAAVAAALHGARLLVSGSAALPAVEHARIERVCGRRVLERYGLTETLIVTAERADGPARPGTVGPPLPGVELRLVGDGGEPLAAADGETIGEVCVRGPSLFSGYLGREPATAAATDDDGWFRTGDLALREPAGALRIVGRRATDLIKSGGYKIGAGEIEAALREHPAVDDAAVTGEADADLGERVVAWVVLRDGTRAGADELAAHVAALLAPHKRPRVVHLLADLPRNELGKVLKGRLRAP